MAKPTRTIINLNPDHRFVALAQYPLAQLLLLVPRKLWLRTLEYVPAFEDVRSAGRFGADPGDYEWEVLENPSGLKWWRRHPTSGEGVYCGAIFAPADWNDPVELYGILDIAEDSPWWLDGIEHVWLVRGKAEIVANRQKIPLEEAENQTSREYYREHDALTSGPNDEVAWRLGSPDEVRWFKDSVVGLLKRANEATLPREVAQERLVEPTKTFRQPTASAGPRPARSTGPLAATRLAPPGTGPLASKSQAPPAARPKAQKSQAASAFTHSPRASYRPRPATFVDLDALVQQRRAMFAEAAQATDATNDQAYEEFVTKRMAAGDYFGWVVEAEAEKVIASGSIFCHDWIPGPDDEGGRRACVVSLYVAPEYRHQGLAQQIIGVMRDFCRSSGIRTLSLYANVVGRYLHTAHGFQNTSEMQMRLD